MMVHKKEKKNITIKINVLFANKTVIFFNGHRRNGCIIFHFNHKLLLKSFGRRMRKFLTLWLSYRFLYRIGFISVSSN